VYVYVCKVVGKLREDNKLIDQCTYICVAMYFTSVHSQDSLFFCCFDLILYNRKF